MMEILISLAAGIGISAVVMFFFKMSLKSVRYEDSACNYVRSGSFNLTGKKDLFLYSNIVRIRRQQKNN